MACKECVQYRRDLRVAISHRQGGKAVSISLEASAALLRQKIANLQKRKNQASNKTN